MISSFYLDKTFSQNIFSCSTSSTSIDQFYNFLNKISFAVSENSRNVKKRVFKLKSENNKVALKQVLPKEGKYINIDWA